jgi:FkbM family methyltransferase
MNLKTLASKILGLIHMELRSSWWDFNSKFRESITVTTKQGIFTVLLADSGIGKSLYCDRQFELASISETMKFLRSIQKCPPKGEGTIVDIGANNGVISIGALHIGELEKAIAIEPDPQNFSLLQHNVNQNGLKDRVICLPYAASHTKGELVFELSNTNYGDHRVRGIPNSARELDRESERNVITVQADQLDNLLSDLPKDLTQTIALVWVDVQGFEGYVFMGAKGLLSKGVPVVAEIWPYGIERAGMAQEEFCSIVASIWSNYWVWRRGKFVRYPLNTLDILFDEVGYGGDHDNVIFT